MKHLIYLIGVPGCGKTTLFSELTQQWAYYVADAPFAHTRYENGIIELGKKRTTFGGTDTLSMSVQPKVLQWLLQDKPDIVIGEGDRLANAKFFTGVRKLGYSLRVYFLNTPSYLVDERRAERGSNQNPTWLRGRETKVQNLVTTWVHPNRILDGQKQPKELAEWLWNTDLQLLMT